MLNKFLIGIALIISLTVPAFAADTSASGQISLSNHYLDRGVILSNDPSLGLDLNVNNVALPGIFVETNLQTIRPVSQHLTFYSDLGVGYQNQVGMFDGKVSVNRVENGIFNNGEAYSEGRLEVGATPFNGIRFNVHASQPFTARTNDTYYGVGASMSPFFLDKLTVGIEANAYRYSGTHTNTFNNATLSARYNVLGNVDLYGLYSYGGNGIVKRNSALYEFETKNPLSNTWMVGTAVRF